MPPKVTAVAASLGFVLIFGGCQSGGMDSARETPGFEYNASGSASTKVNAELDADATAFGTAQGVAGAAAAMDPTGLSSIPLMAGGNAAHKAWLTKSHARMEAAAEEDLQATYRKYGLNPDGTPSGRPGPGSSLAD